MATILVVDDRSANREFLVTLLGYQNHRLLEAGDGAAALAVARAQRPDLVISDILMPTMDGYEFVRQLRMDQEIAATRVIFYTANYKLQEAGHLAASCGVARVLTKPCDPQVILDAVADALRAPAQPPAQWPPRDFDHAHLRVVTDKLSQTAAALRTANQRLREREAALRRAQSVAMLAHVITAPDGSFETWSETLPQLIGVDSARMPHSTREWLDLIHPEDRAQIREPDIDAGTRPARADFEYRIRRGGGEWIHIRQVIEPLASEAAAPGASRAFITLQDVTGQKRVEAALRQSKEELRELAAAANSAREQEKSRIARELHDGLAQSLTSLKMDLAAARAQLPPAQQPLLKWLLPMQLMLDGMVAETRRIAADLRPLVLDDLGLVPAAEWLVQNFIQRTGIECRLSVDPPQLELEDPHATAIFRILQESLANAGRHARASLVEVTLDGNGGEIVLRVRDNGSGFDTAHARKPDSFGLVGLRERASLLSGEVCIDSAPGRGTLIEVRIPSPDSASP